MLNKLLIAPVIFLCVLTLSISAQAQTAKKKIKKTVVTTTTEEVDENGKVIKKTEKVESESDDSDTDTKETPKKSGQWEQGSSTPPPTFPTSDPTLPSINESWYTLWGLGFGKANYSGTLGDIYEDSENLAGADRSSTLSMDLLGFYWPLTGHKTMIGFIINGASDSIEYSNGNKNTITTSLLAFSAHHFFGRNIGDGFFVRGDVGFSRASIDVEIGASDYDDTSDSEIGFLVGAGYAVPVSLDTRLLVGLYIRPIPKVEFDSASDLKGTVTSITAGFLF